METSDYGLSIDNPIHTTCIEATTAFIENLVTDKGYHFLYHRKESISGYFTDNGFVQTEHPVDHYQLFDGEKKLHDLYFSVYHDENLMIPPQGFKFRFDEIGYYDADDQCFINTIDELHVFDMNSITNIFKYLGEAPILEQFLYLNLGTNMYVDDFPESLLKTFLEENYNDDGGEIFQKIIKT